MSTFTHVVLVLLLILAGSIWAGGYVVIAVVAMAARRSLQPAARVEFFRALGRSYLRVGGPALALALTSGLVLLLQRGWNWHAWVALGLAVALMASLVIAVQQARHMSRLRQRLVVSPGDAQLETIVRVGGRSAAMLRGVLGVLSLGLLVLGTLIASL